MYVQKDDTLNPAENNSEHFPTHYDNWAGRKQGSPLHFHH